MPVQRFRVPAAGVILATAFLAGAVVPVGQRDHLPPVRLLQARALFGVLPATMPGAHLDTPAQVTLGERLYFERAMSQGKVQSCNDCHPIEGLSAGADNLTTSRGALRKFGPRNAPTTLNAGFQVAQFWDGRAATLAEQAIGPILNPVEMAAASPEDVVERLREHPGEDYATLFAEAFPGMAEPLVYDNVGRALAAFERTLVTPARFDDFVGGDPDALTVRQKSGFDDFVNRGCVQCHAGPLWGGMTYQKIGVHAPYPYSDDPGRAAVTGDDRDHQVFKVPALRNVALTAPYYHDGNVATLAEALDLMARLQLDRPYEDVVALRDTLRLMHALTGTDRLAANAPPEQHGDAWWDPRTPAALAGNPEAAPEVVYGYELTQYTYDLIGPGAADAAMRYAGNGLNCTSCHIEQGTKQFGLPWVGVADRFPQYRGRENAVAELEDRIRGCFERSMNGTSPPRESREMQAMVAYLEWLSEETPTGLAGLSVPRFPAPDRAADPDAGAEVYRFACQSCHGADGAGYQADLGGRTVTVTPALWGPQSYNDGAGMHRQLKASAFVHANMPLGTSWRAPALTPAQAYDVAAFINSHARPAMTGLDADYPDKTKKPIDAPYGPYADPFPQEQHKYGPFQPIREYYANQKTAD
jgi:cytochrome c